MINLRGNDRNSLQNAKFFNDPIIYPGNYQKLEKTQFTAKVTLNLVRTCLIRLVMIDLIEMIQIVYKMHSSLMTWELSLETIKIK